MLTEVDKESFYGKWKAKSWYGNTEKDPLYNEKFITITDNGIYLTEATDFLKVGSKPFYKWDGLTFTEG